MAWSSEHPERRRRSVSPTKSFIPFFYTDLALKPPLCPERTGSTTQPPNTSSMSRPCSPQHRRGKYSVWLFGSLAAPTQGFGRYKYLCLNSAALQPCRSLWLHPPAPRGGVWLPSAPGSTAHCVLYLMQTSC